MKKLFTLIALALMCAAVGRAATPILGKPVLTTDQMYQFVKSKDAGSSFTYEIAQYFHDLGEKWGIRGDIALCQSCIETGWFKYTGGTAVTPDDHNYSGLGVTQLGQKGCQFATVEEGVTAQLQHLWAYATKNPLPSGWTLVDTRFNYVSRGVAPNWEDLGSGKWASAANYGNSIMSIYNDMKAHAGNPSTPEPDKTGSIDAKATPTWLTCNADMAEFMSNGYRESTVTVNASNVKGDITASFDGDADNELTITPAKLGSEGGTFTVRYTPTIARTNYLKPVLTISAANAEPVNITFYIKWDGTTGVDDIVADSVDAPVEFYNLQGVRMNGDSLAPGIYIRRQGNKTAKVLVR